MAQAATHDRNGTWTEYGYDDLNRLQTVANKRGSGEVISSFAYTHNEINNRAWFNFSPL